MAASANPYASSNNGTTTINNGGRSAVPKNSGVGLKLRALKHRVDISVQWTPDEQSLLEELLVKYASYSKVMRYARIAGKLQDKTARDVALRCRWMSKKEIGKRRKDDNLSWKHKDKREKVGDQQGKPSSHAMNRANGLMYAQSSVSMESDDGISYKAIGGVSGQLLEQNAQALDQISANFSSFKVHENTSLLCQTRNNIITILNNLNDMPEIMKRLPPLPVKLNDELANSILPQSFMTMKP